MNQNFDAEEFYVTNDADFLASIFTTNLAFLGINWKQMLGRPTITIVATHNHLGNSATNKIKLIASAFLFQKPLVWVSTVSWLQVKENFYF